ncbi:hypothetical protein [Burkholderia anthina]|uniref:hypothetical protein n=1 Tax=Burkholderia anthina TaxID=179879 RepID=UPI00158F55FA|nr:hypothetical protein [Burkholderia anthina]
MELFNIERLIVAARKGKTADGKVTIASSDLRAAAAKLGGYAPPMSKRTASELRRLGGERVANGHSGARYAFDPASIAAIESQYQ